MENQAETLRNRTDAPPLADPAREEAARLVGAIYDPALLIDPAARRIVAANAQAADLLGYPPADLAHLSPDDLHPHEPGPYRDFVARVLDRGRFEADHLSCRTRSGALVPARIQATAIALEAGIRVMVIIRDRRTDALVEIGRSVRKVAHDLRNALATSQLTADRLTGHDDPAVRASSAVLMRTLERAVVMCEDIGRAGRAEERPLARERFLLDDVIEEVMATAKLPGPVGCDIRLARHGVVLDADFDRIYRILANLARNATQAGARYLTVDATRTGSTAHIRIADDGPGLPPGIAADLAAEKPSAAPDGSGIGLVIAHELARDHDGTLTIERTGPEGTVFLLSLPGQS